MNLFKTTRRLALSCALVFVFNMVSAQQKRVAIVIDDGPVPENAASLLELFAREQIHASFAHVGRTVQEHAATSKSLVAAGHELVNHSHTHAHPQELDDPALHQEIVGAQEAIIAATGTTPSWYWPPFGEFDQRMPELYQTAGIKAYQPRNFVSSEDWNREVGAEEIYRRATSGIEDLSVILFHEWRDETIEQMPAIIAELKRQGCTFYTFSQLAEL